MLKLKWGPRRDSSAKGFDERSWRASLQEKELAMRETLRPGAWNPVSFALAPADIDTFGYLELSMETDDVSLRR